MKKTSIGVYCDKVIYSVVLTEEGPIQLKSTNIHDGRMRHFRFIKYLKSFGDFDMCVIVQNDEAKPVVNYLRREKKRPFLPIDFSPIAEQANYKENPDLPTIARKLAYKKRQSDILFEDDQLELKNGIEQLGGGEKAIHMRTLDPVVLAFMAAAHGIFTLEMDTNEV